MSPEARRRHWVHCVQSQSRLSWLSSGCSASLLCQSAIAQSGSTLSCDVTRCLDQLLRSLSLSTPITFRTKDGFCPLLPGVKAWPLGPQPDYGQSEVGVVGVVCLNVPHVACRTYPVLRAVVSVKKKKVKGWFSLNQDRQNREQLTWTCCAMI